MTDIQWPISSLLNMTTFILSDEVSSTWPKAMINKQGMKRSDIVHWKVKDLSSLSAQLFFN